MKSKLILAAICISIIVIAVRASSDSSDYVTPEQNAIIAETFLSKLPLPLPVEGKISPESLQQFSATKGIRHAIINPGAHPFLTAGVAKGKSLIKEYGSEKAKGMLSGFERHTQLRRDIIVMDPLLQDNDQIRIISNGRAVDLTLTNDPKSTVFEMKDKFFLIEALYDGDGKGVAVSVVIEEDNILKPIFLPVMQVGDKIKVMVI